MPHSEKSLRKDSIKAQKRKMRTCMCMLEYRQVMESESTDRLSTHYHLRSFAINLSRNAIRRTH